MQFNAGEQSEWRHELFRALWELWGLLLALLSPGLSAGVALSKAVARIEQGKSSWRWHALWAKQLISVPPALRSARALLHRGLMYNGSQAATSLGRIKRVCAASDLWELYRERGRVIVVPAWTEDFFFSPSSASFKSHCMWKMFIPLSHVA